jgi:translocation protein SEC63
MRLHAYLVQALLPSSERSSLAQLPGVKTDDVLALPADVEDIGDFVNHLEENHDSRAVEVKKAIQKWGRAEIVDAAFKGIILLCSLPQSTDYCYSHW